MEARLSYDPRWNRVVEVVGININSAGSDNALTLPAGVAKWRPTKLTITDASTSLAASAATIGLFTSTGGGGTTLVTAALLTSLTGATVCFDMTLLGAASANYLTGQTVYLRNVLAHGSAATVRALLYYDWMG
jgi:hypothetical protein